MSDPGSQMVHLGSLKMLESSGFENETVSTHSRLIGLDLDETHEFSAQIESAFFLIKNAHY